MFTLGEVLDQLTEYFHYNPKDKETFESSPHSWQLEFILAVSDGMSIPTAIAFYLYPDGETVEGKSA